jgi:iron(III) transport system permease protein
MSTLAAARGRFAGVPWLILILATAVTAAVLLSPVYLVLRAAERSDTIWAELTDETTVHAIGRTLWLTLTVTGASILIAVPAAWLTLRTDLPLRSVWTVTLALPLAIPSFVGGFITVSALGPGGMLQDVLSPLGVERLPSLYGFKGAWLTLTFLSYPYVYLTVRAALRRADPALEEASRSLGKSAMETFLRINLPQLRPGIAAGALLLALYCLSEFGAVAMLRYDTLTPIVYIQYTSSFDRSAAAVLGLPLIVLTVAFLLLDSVTRGNARYHTTGQTRPARQLRLGAWKWPAVFFCFVVSFIGIGMPVLVILYWLIKGLQQGESTSLLGEYVFHSAQASSIAALLAVAAALPVALLSVRHSGPVSSILEKLAYAGQSLPGITIALALVFFAANYLNPFYQTLTLLVFAYGIRFLPEALGSTRTAMLQVNPHTEEASRGLGAGPVRTFFRVTAPQILPGMSAGGLLVFLTAMKELPITLLLSPIGYDTLATRVWASTTQAFFTQAALPALVLVGVSAVAVVLLLRREQERT